MSTNQISEYDFAIIIQARTGSQRFPNKVIKPFYKGESLLTIQIKRIKSTAKIPIIIATTTSKQDDPIIDIAKNEEVYFFRGSEDDVLNRFIACAEKFGVCNIIRFCSDNPFVDQNSLVKLVQEFSSKPCDYISFSLSGTPSIKTHFGFYAEAVKTDALKKIEKLTKDKIYKEHVTNYIYEHPSKFVIRWIDVPENIASRNDIRLTIDTAEDFKLATEIFSALSQINPKFEIIDVIWYLDQHTEYLEKMKQHIADNKK